MATFAGGREPRIVPFLAHNEPWFLLAIPVALFAVHFLDDPAGTAVALLVFVMFFVVTSASQRHYHHYLCTRCAAATPLDGTTAAAKNARTLHAFHWSFETHRKQSAAITLVFAAAVLGSILAHMFALSVVSAVALYGGWALDAWLRLRHRPLQPWCEQCGWNGGRGPHEHVPTPDPTMETTA